MSGDDLSVGSESGSVGEDFPVQQRRVMDLLVLYKSLPNGAGEMAACLMHAALCRSFDAAISGDVLQIISAYEELKGFKE